MEISNTLLESMTQMAVVTAMNIAAAAFSVPRPAGGTEAVVDELQALVTATVAGRTVILTLDWYKSVSVAPLYGAFFATWKAAQVRLRVLEQLKSRTNLQEVDFDLKMVTN